MDLISCERFEMIRDEETTSEQDGGVQINKFCARWNSECVCACACAWYGRLRDWVFRRRGDCNKYAHSGYSNTGFGHSMCAERLTVLSRKISFSVALQLFASSHQSGPVAIFPHDRSPSNCGLRLMTSITEGPECLYRLDLIHSSFFLCLSFSLVFPSLLAQPSRAFAIKRALRVSLDTRTIPLQW